MTSATFPTSSTKYPFHNVQFSKSNDENAIEQILVVRICQLCPMFRIPNTTSMLFSIYILVEIFTFFLLG